jgi:radical SAM superfamily enzyme YgiQ (UPF0313 family)
MSTLPREAATDTVRQAPVQVEARRQGAAGALRAELLDATLARFSYRRAARRAIAGRTLPLHLHPDAFAESLEAELAGRVARVIVNGTFDRRLLLLQGEENRMVACSLDGSALGTLPWPTRVPSDLELEQPDAPVSDVLVSADLVRRLTTPEIVIVALYHPENFPLPRFPLGISDLARAVRSTLMGHVTLLDMQFGLTVEDVGREIRMRSPDIVGISATFGQHDVLTAVMAELAALEGSPLVVFGGSLSALNRDILLDEFPDGLVCFGPGEPTMQDVVAAWHGNIPSSAVRSVARRSSELALLRSFPRNREYDDIVPELDLLERTLEFNGVMQLESSRGCTHACSFCPRSHKGRWNGYHARLFENVIAEVNEVYARAPHISRKLFLVDEEFVGSNKHGDALSRASGVSDLLDDAGFRWETSTRVDQIYRADRDREWHLERIRFWSHLRDHGLSRCLFGVESGVDSILERFNKHTTADQNAYAIRMLTGLAVPIRCTYITFDQLMTIEELIESYRFQGRDDLILRPLREMSPEAFFDAVHDESFVAARKTGRPFYSSISYMLVSMEALIGSPYLQKVEEAGLAREWQPSMGRRRAEYRDQRIGLMSDASQRWVDRNFSFDYTLKSIEKITHGTEQNAARAARVVLKRSAYHLFGRMLAITTSSSDLLAADDSVGAALVADVEALTGDAMRRLLDRSFEELKDDFETVMGELRTTLRPERWEVVSREHARWSERESWELINA